MSSKIPLKYNELSLELTAMAKKDQTMRRKALKAGVWPKEDIDEKNTKRMKEIVEKFGWPTISMVGEKPSQDAWLLVQHADKDIEFQKLCLELMKTVKSGDITPKNIAYLEDRVRVNSNQPQLYGTQFFKDDGTMKPRPIENPEEVDQRRQSVGLKPLEEYAQEFIKFNDK